MQKIHDFSLLNAQISACLRPGLVTNCVLSGQKLRALIAAGQLYAHAWPGGLVLLWRTPSVNRLYFYLTDPAVPPDSFLSEPVVCEYTPRAGKPALPAPWWEAYGFCRVLTRTRLTRPAGPASGAPPAPPQPVSVQTVLHILNTCFPPDTGCIPTLSDLQAAVSAGNVLTRAQNGACVAALHVEPGRGFTQLRHLAVLPAARGQGLAAQLVQEFTARFGTQTCRVWVAEGNDAARHLYEKNGFSSDGTSSFVWKLERN